MHVDRMKEARLRNRLGLRRGSRCLQAAGGRRRGRCLRYCGSSQSQALEQNCFRACPRQRHCNARRTAPRRIWDGERAGTGIVIEDNGCPTPIGYLMAEAISAEITTNEGRTVGANVGDMTTTSGFRTAATITPCEGLRALQMGKAYDIKAGDRLVVRVGTAGRAACGPSMCRHRGYAGNGSRI